MDPAPSPVSSSESGSSEILRTRPERREPLDLRSIRRSLAPAETGGWFISLFPLLAGLAARPTGRGLAMGALAFVAFLSRVPLRQWHQGIRPRVSRLLLGLAGAFLVAILALLLRTEGTWALLPPLLALPFGLAALAADLRRKSRNLLVELSALAFFCVFGGGIPWAGGAGPGESFRLGALAFFTLAPGFAAVRYHLQARREIPGPEPGPRRLEMHLVMGGCLAAGAFFWSRSWCGPAWLILQVLLYPRALLSLRKGPAWRIGVLEVLADAAGLALAVLGW